ncbi:1-deoxy-D-xylulose-5-phosphate synthase N-terminal domain-containing protein [Corynebacterium sphenisci]|uniref:1-deoxy-D-xylulose-5-phosphate synthase N-terminal domain-containing protein n=1 Tax=Corynebacterium sphenisci TaxID=191493 RepID=UPI0026DFE9A2|nr:1-deoxy-D-xylulose-5-phosphate synthase N-terminal domain-containing protein [Corynebacterium sphenisci]MDO5731298.1 1-deoxy-D-xylulose-5-phosphate synthase N-terminal domain-containing protein [Corynebacterium sphenisci]
MGILERITSPADLRRLDAGELARLAAEIRALLVSATARRGGHLGSNLGVVELSIALHRVADSPRDPILFDIGHQAYVHKILTGRAGRFGGLRTAGGLSGYPARAESPHDWLESSHASAAPAVGLGLARALHRTGPDRTVYCVLGDGSLTGGMALEALNLAAADPGAGNLVLLVNDNGRSYGPTAGAVPARLDRVAAALGLPYAGPVDGHDIAAVERALAAARAAGGVRLVHARTEKGHGHPPALADAAEAMHTVPPAGGGAPGRTWTAEFGDWAVAAAAADPRVHAVTAAMTGPTGLAGFARRFPDRLHDAGIAEQAALGLAAGLSLGGARPVVAMYSTFLQRALDQLLMELALLRRPVLLAVDRAGVTGPDGPSHNGAWDLVLAAATPGLRAAAPRDAAGLRTALDEGLAGGAGPALVRYPRGALPDPVPATGALPGAGGVELLGGDPGAAEVLLVGIGAMAPAAAAAGRLLRARGVPAAVAHPRWVLPPPPELLAAARGRRLVVSVEDGLARGGAGAALAAALAGTDPAVAVVPLGLPARFLGHGDRAAILAGLGLDGPGIAARVRALLDGATAPRGR